MALYAVLYSLEAVIAESGILSSCIPRASRHTGGFGGVKPLGVNVEKRLTIVMWKYLRWPNAVFKCLCLIHHYVLTIYALAPFLHKFLEILTTGSLEIGKFLQKQFVSIFRATAHRIVIFSNISL